MPRVNLGRNYTAESLTKLIQGAKAANKTSQAQMAVILDVSQPTMKEKERHPEKLTIEQYLRLGRALHIPIEELRAALRY